MFPEKRVVLAAAVRLDAEDPCLDAVLEAARDRLAKFFDPPHCVWRTFRERRLGEVAPFDRQPKPVYPFVRETVEIRLRVVVDVIHQLVVVEWRTLDWPEEASRDAVAHPWLADAWGEIAGAHAVLVVVYGAAKPLVVLGRNRRLAVLVNVDPVAFASFHGSAHERDVVRRHRRQSLRPRQFLAERPVLYSRIWRRIGKGRGQGRCRQQGRRQLRCTWRKKAAGWRNRCLVLSLHDGYYIKMGSKWE